MSNLSTPAYLPGAFGRAAFLKEAFGPGVSSSARKYQASCEVVFGAPSANCVGTGVCKIIAKSDTAAIASLKKDCKRVSALLMPCENGHGVSLIIAREMMCIHLLRTQFKNSQLSLSESCGLPGDIVNQLDLKISKIRPGAYTIDEVNGFFRINFR